MVPECRNRPEPVVNNQQYPFSSGVDDDRSRSKDEDSVETKISNSDDDRVGARKDLAHGLTARPHGQGVAPNSIVFYCDLLYSIVFYCILVYSILFSLYPIVFYCILIYSIVFCCILLYSIAFYCILLYSIVF